jgi:hypothetical protein
MELVKLEKGLKDGVRKKRGDLPKFEFKIEPNPMPLPKRKPGPVSNYLFELLEVGQVATINRSYQAVAKAFKKREGQGDKVLRVHSLVKGKSCRVWRMK